MTQKINKINKINKVLLIDPKGFGSGLNLGLGYLAAVLIENNYKVKVLDCNNDPIRLSSGPKINLGLSRISDWKEKIEMVLRWEPDLIGFSLNSFSLNEAIEVVRYCQSISKKNAVYVAGGPHVAIFKGKFLEEHNNLFDFAIIGEGEETMLDLVRNIKSPEKVKGLVYFDRKKKKVIQTENRPLITDLDSLPFPNFDVFDSIDKQKGIHNYQMISSRGCPYQCVFCNHLWTTKWRARTPENIIKEIKEVKRKYHVKSITFWDDNFSLDLNRAKKVCDLLIMEKINLEYYLAGIRADRVDEELIKKLKESGCKSISLGIEDGDPKTFPFVNKGETLEQIKKTVKLIQKYQIPLLTYMVTGLINHSYKSFLRSLSLIEELKVKAHWSIAFPFPNTVLYDWAKKNGRFLMSLEEGFLRSMTNKDPAVVFDTKIYPKEERLKAYYQGNLRSKSYDMVVSSRGGNFFKQGLEIFESIWKYDRERMGWHFKNLFEMSLGLVLQKGKVK